MKKLFDWILLGIGFIIVIGITHAAVTLTATDWESLTSAKWNSLIDKVSWITSQVDGKVNMSELCDETWSNCKDISVWWWGGNINYLGDADRVWGTWYPATNNLFIKYNRWCPSSSSIYTYDAYIRPVGDSSAGDLVAAAHCMNGENHTSSSDSFIVPQGYEYRFNRTPAWAKKYQL